MSFVSPNSLVLGIDDTDMPGIGGTGQLARRLAVEIHTSGLGVPTGVTRHQFFAGPGVPKTSRNSAAAIGFGAVASSASLFEMVSSVVSRECIVGSDPGVAMGYRPLHSDLIRFAQSAQRGLVTQAEARRLAAVHEIDLIGLGGTEDGVIGALGAMALRVDGNDGRYVGLPGIREISGVVTVAEILDRTEIADVVDQPRGDSLERASLLDLGDWVRPRLIAGRPVLVARRDGDGWVNADSRSK